MLGIQVRRRRDQIAAKTFFRTLFNGCQYVPPVIVTDKLKSYSAAKRESVPGVEHRQHSYVIDRTENPRRHSHQRERRMQGFKSPGHAQRVPSAYGAMAPHCRPGRLRLSPSECPQAMRHRFDTWQGLTTLPAAA